jgi:peptidoglycan/LPS O-acetylase OafA/YrhL
MTNALQRSPVGSSRRHAAAHAPKPRKFRPDIEGMRALAVLLVVLYHANIAHVHGGFVGVDVFFVISGFLITRQLMESVGRRGLRALPTFYTRRIRRLLPASMTVVVATVVAARFWAPPLSVRPIAVDGIFTTFYGLNYRLAAEGTQYLNQGNVASPLQHYWSLAVEEQFYLCWPILIVLVAFLGRRFRKELLTLVLVGLVAVSFYYSISITKVDAPLAYFSLQTRAWELALGALVAVGSSQLARLPGFVASGGSCLALAAVVVAAFLYNDSTAYPGSAAALPVVGAAVVIACGCGPPRPVERLLGVRPLQFVGRISYSWYLWHWPMLVIAPMIIGRALTWPQRVGVVGLSLVASIFTYYAIEKPARSFQMPNRYWFASGAALSGTAIAAAVLIIFNLPTLVGHGAPVTIVQPGAPSPQVTRQMQEAVAAGLATIAAPSNLTPRPADAHGDVPDSSNNGCHASLLAVTQGPCVYGDPTGKYTVVLFGDSHMQQWQPAFSNAGAEAHWRVVNWTKSACPPAELTVFDSELNRIYTECNTWRQATLKRIAALKPNVVVLTGSENLAASNVSPAAYADATVATIRVLEQTTTAKIIYFEDTPYPAYNMAGCVAAHLDDVKPCDLAVSHAYTYPDRHAATRLAIEKLGGVTIVDPQPWICDNTECPAIVGNLLVYRDESHISVEFSEWLTPMITSLLEAQEPGHHG